jgi:hypothetical protein
MISEIGTPGSEGQFFYRRRRALPVQRDHLVRRCSVNAPSEDDRAHLAVDALVMNGVTSADPVAARL